MKKRPAITPAWIFVQLNEKRRSFWAALISATRFPTAPQWSWDFCTWCFVLFISHRHTNPANKVSDTSQSSWETLFIIVCLWSNNNSLWGEQLCFHPTFEVFRQKHHVNFFKTMLTWNILWLHVCRIYICMWACLDVTTSKQAHCDSCSCFFFVDPVYFMVINCSGTLCFVGVKLHHRSRLRPHQCS